MDSKNVRGGVIIKKEMKLKAEIIACWEDWKGFTKQKSHLRKYKD